ncbi:VCBS repeat-containing protein [Mycoplasmatota bacterium WC44]
MLDYKEEDINGDGISDYVYLVGNRPYGSKSPFFSNLTLLIQEGNSGCITKIPLKENAGYTPTIFLGDFTGNRVSDVLVSIDSGGSGGYAFYYIYSYLKGVPKKIFDHNDFNQYSDYDVIYKNNYQVEVHSKDKSYIINILYKGLDYLSDIYTDKGKLKEPIKGWVNPLGGLYPVDFKKNKIYELYATRRIAGRYNADNLGYVQTSLSWNGTEFTPFFQTVGILG